MLHAGAGAAETLRVAGNFPVKHSSSIAMKKFAKSVAKLTNGKLKVETFPAMQLGGAKENVDQVSSGAIFGAWIGVAYLSRIVPQLEAISLLFVYPDQKTAFRVLDGKVGRVLNAKLAKKGVRPWVGWSLGFATSPTMSGPLKALRISKAWP